MAVWRATIGAVAAVIAAVTLSLSAAHAQETDPPLPAGPSIAVLSFVNMSTNRDLQYLSDGMAEDIIRDLGSVASLLVIAPDSSFRFARVPLPKMGQQLGVRHVLKGRAGRVGDSLRIQAELYDAAKETQLWSEEFIGPLGTVSALQDAVVEKVLSSLEISPTAPENQLIRRVRTTNWPAYDFFLLARGKLFRPTRQNVQEARRAFERSLKMEPAFAGSLAGISKTYAISAELGYTRALDSEIRKAREFADRAVAADDTYPAAHRALAAAAFLSGDHDLAVSAAQRAAELVPNDAAANLFFGFYLAWAGRGGEAVAPIERAIRLSPLSTTQDRTFLGFAYASAGRHDEAIATFAGEKALGNRVPAFALAYWTAALVESGRTEDARAMAADILATFPTFTVSAWGKTLRYKNASDAERHLKALTEAGLPN